MIDERKVIVTTALVSCTQLVRYMCSFFKKIEHKRLIKDIILCTVGVLRTGTEAAPKVQLHFSATMQ